MSLLVILLLWFGYIAHLSQWGRSLAVGMTHRMNPVVGMTHRMNPVVGMTHRMNPEVWMTHRMNLPPRKKSVRYMLITSMAKLRISHIRN
jgi:hypothetical protein